MTRTAILHGGLIRHSWWSLATETMKVSDYFRSVRSRPDRAVILDEWILRAVTAPEHQEIQDDGRVRRWARIPEAGGRFLRVVLLADGETVHNAFFDRGFGR